MKFGRVKIADRLIIGVKGLRDREDAVVDGFFQDFPYHLGPHHGLHAAFVEQFFFEALTLLHHQEIAARRNDQEKRKIHHNGDFGTDASGNDAHVIILYRR